MLRSPHGLALVAMLSAGCAFGEAVATDAGDDRPDARPDGPTLDAGVDAPVDAGCVDQWLELLGNADFEGGNDVWSETTNGGQLIIREVGAGLPFDPEGGVWGALMLGFNNADVTLAQSVTVPDDATALRLRGFRCWVTDEGAGEFDLMSIDILDDGGVAVEQLLALTNEDAAATCAWEPFEIDAVETRAGETIELSFAGTSDPATVTSFAFDTLALEALVCR